MQWRIWCASSGNIWAYSIAQNCEWMIKVISPSFNHVLNESNFHISLFILKMIEKIIFFEKFCRFSLVLYSCCECGGQSKISHTFVNVFYFGVGFYGSSLKRDEFQSILYSFGHIRWTHYCLTHTHTQCMYEKNEINSFNYYRDHQIAQNALDPEWWILTTNSLISHYLREIWPNQKTISYQVNVVWFTQTKRRL